MRAMKAVYGLWADIQIGQLNKLLKPFGCRLVKKTSKDWGQAVSVTAHALEEVVLTPPGSTLAIAGYREPCLARDHVWVEPEGGSNTYCSVCGVPQPTLDPVTP